MEPKTTGTGKEVKGVTDLNAFVHALPPGWSIMKLEEYDNRWLCHLNHRQSEIIIVGHGSSPHAAVAKAISNIQT